jgi:glycosyltransferase involved in cell wall biosynthesis
VSHLNLKQKSVIPNGFDLSQLNEVHKKPEYKEKTKSDSLHLITVGNLTQRKGQHNVIKALPLLIKTYPNLIYHIVGLPTDQVRLENLASKLGIEEHIRYHGRQAEEEKIKLLLASDVFMMLSEQTSTGDVEGFGIAILEANALGLPAVGSLNCGIEDAIKADYSGQLVDPHEPQAILEAVGKITSRRETYAKQAKAWSTNFTWDKIGQLYIEKIEEHL